MSADSPISHDLTLHPEMRCGCVETVQAQCSRRTRDELVATFTVVGKMDRILVPPVESPRRTDFLWQHTCFELFVAVDGSEGYHEFNLSPSTEWAIYGFRAYREIESIGDDSTALTIASTSSDTHVQLISTIRLSHLSSLYPKANLRLGLCAVIEETTGNLSYWALHHPPGQADFHHRDAFAAFSPLPR